MNELIRTCIFRPYIKREDLPVFTLQIFDTHNTENISGGKYIKFRVAYKLHMKKNGKSIVLIEGEDFYTPNSIDSDKTVCDLMGWLTLRPEDTDQGYFEKYSEAALEYCSEHAESLNMCVIDRLGGGLNHE